jgi:hypothetical protein
MKQAQNSLPEWYWSLGLHDANIILVTKKESNWNPDDNCLILKIDCNGALFEADITEIRFYNYKVKTNDFDMSLLNGGWWLSDEITKKYDRYLLDLEFATAKCKTKHFEIIFQRAEVIRE